MNLYSIDIKICATAYIRAKTAAEAKRIAEAMAFDGLELREDEYQDPPICGKGFDDPALPDVSLSPAMTIHGRWGSKPELVAEDVPAHEGDT